MFTNGVGREMDAAGWKLRLRHCPETVDGSYELSPKEQPANAGTRSGHLIAKVNYKETKSLFL
jgi:hypothetical protein